MASLGDFTEFASLTKAIAKDPFQLISPIAKSKWNFQLKSNQPEAANLYQRISEFGRDHYGLEDLNDLFDAYEKPEENLCDVQEHPELPRSLNVCGVEIKYARPLGIPGSDSELTDSDFESDSESFPRSENQEKCSDERADSNPSNESESPLRESSRTDIPGEETNERSEERIDNSSSRLPQALQGIIGAAESGTNREKSVNSFEHHEEACNASKEHHDGQSSKPDDLSTKDPMQSLNENVTPEPTSYSMGANSELVYGYASTVSPSSRRMSRVSIAGMAHSRRCSVNIGVQPQFPARAFMASPDQLREVRRRSSMMMFERRKSVMFSNENVLGFPRAVNARNEVFTCEVAGRSFELVVANCSRPGAEGAGVQCSAADIDGTIDVLFAEPPPTPDLPPKRKKVDAAVQWTGSPEVSQCDRQDLEENSEDNLEDDIGNPDEPMSTAHAGPVPSSQQPCPVSPRMALRKSAPAKLLSSAAAFGRQTDREVTAQASSELPKPDDESSCSASQSLSRQHGIRVITETLPQQSKLDHKATPNARQSLNRQSGIKVVAQALPAQQQFDIKTNSTNSGAHQSEAMMATERSVVGESALQALDEAMQQVETIEHQVEMVLGGLQNSETSAPVSEKCDKDNSEQKKCPDEQNSDGKMVSKSTSMDTALHEANHETVTTAPAEGPDVYMDDDNDDNFEPDDAGFPADDDEEPYPIPEPTGTESNPAVTMQDTDPNAKELSFSSQRDTIMISSCVDVEPQATSPIDSERAPPASKKRVREKKPRATRPRASTKGAEGGSRKRGASRRELKRLGLTSVHLAKAEQRPVEADDGDQPRRSKRRKFPPLQYWRNEKKVYERRKSQLLPTISEVVVAVDHVDGEDSDVSWGDLQARGVVGSRR